MSMAREELAQRVRDLMPRGIFCTEKKMFSGVAFMAQGNMLVAPLKDGTMMVRVGKDGLDAALSEDGASPMQMRGRDVTGFVLVSGDALEDDEALRSWLERAWAFVQTLPAK